MPELPDITVYLEALQSRLLNHTLERIQVKSPFLLRTALPPITEAQQRKVKDLRRIGKRVAIGLESELWLVFHLMVAGRLHWLASEKNREAPRNVHAALIFENGILSLTEAGTRQRASLHLVKGEVALKEMDPGGIELAGCEYPEFSAVLTRSNHTLKRALTDPRIFSGIGNAYSDEILHAAGLSPLALTQKLRSEEIRTLYDATHEILRKWVGILRQEAKGAFPEKVTAFHPQMAVHGKFGKACPRCGAKVQRIRYASNETNYCPGCQTGGKLLADRGLSLLLKKDWPRTPEELEELRRPR